jgi:hypothetical protein
MVKDEQIFSNTLRNHEVHSEQKNFEKPITFFHETMTVANNFNLLFRVFKHSSHITFHLTRYLFFRYKIINNKCHNTKNVYDFIFYIHIGLTFKTVIIRKEWHTSIEFNQNRRSIWHPIFRYFCFTALISIYIFIVMWNNLFLTFTPSVI